MKKKAVLLSLVAALTFSCVEPDEPKSSSSSSGPNTPDGPIVVEPLSATPIASKNYLQISNTFAKKTGISPGDQDILSEFNAIIMQLPTTSSPESLNGFNQIAQTRLAFAYCDKYVENEYGDYSSLSNADAIKKLLDNMVDVDLDNNQAHQDLYGHLMAIMSDEDNLVAGSGETERKKLFKMSCAALLSSSYVAML